MNRMVRIACAIGLLMQVAVLSTSQESMVIGIIEFEEKTSIGQENAGVIIPELLIVHLKNIGRYKLAERVLLQKGLEEQELQMSGISDESAAARVGQVFGLDAFIVGSAMKVGNKISITGRAIATETAEIIYTGSVEFTNLKELDSKLEELAYQLSGYSEREYRKIEFVKGISKNTLGGAVGLGYAYDVDFALGKLLYGSNLFYKGRYLDFGFYSLGDFAFDYGSMSAVITGYPIARLGIGLGWIWVTYDMPEEYHFTIGKEWYSYSYHALIFGLSYRISEDIRVALYQGPALTGVVRYQSESEDTFDETYPVMSNWFFFNGTPILGTIEYSFLDNWMARVLTIFQNARADTEDFLRSQSILFSFQIGYSYSF